MVQYDDLKIISCFTNNCYNYSVLPCLLQQSCNQSMPIEMVEHINKLSNVWFITASSCHKFLHKAFLNNIIYTLGIQDSYSLIFSFRDDFLQTVRGSRLQDVVHRLCRCIPTFSQS